MFTLPFAIALPVLKGVGGKILNFLKGLTLKQVLSFVLICAALYGVKWVYDKGAQSRQPAIDKLAAENEQMRTLFKTWKEQTASANKEYLEKQSKLVDSLTKERDAANKRANERTPEYKDVIKYVTVQDDSRCTIPVNFGLLHNMSIEGATSAGHSLSETAAGLQGTPSSLTLSQYITIASANNSEAVRRGEIIAQWEQWYDRNLEWFNEAQRKANDAIKRTEAPVSSGK